LFAELNSKIIPAFMGVLSGGGTVSRSPNQTSYTSGTNVTVTATAANGYMFTGWSGAARSTNSSVTIMMGGDRELTANFQEIKTVVIGGKTWMAENLNIATPLSWCYGNSAANCAIYGSFLLLTSKTL